MIKSSLSIFCVVVLVLLTFSSCNMGSDNAHTEVDLSNITDVQITYKQNIYNTRLSFVSGMLRLEIVDADDTLDGLFFEVDENKCRVSYSELVREFDNEYFSDNFFPIVLYKFFSEFNGVVCSESYDDKKMCYSVSRQIYSSFVTFEFFEENQNKAYSVSIK